MIKRTLLSVSLIGLVSCDRATEDVPPSTSDIKDSDYISAPLITDIYAGAPSARVFDGRLYVYPTHDGEAASGKPEHVDYHVFSMSAVGGDIRHDGPIMHVGDVPWARDRLGAPDAIERDGTFYLYFPAEDDRGVFRIGVATADDPAGPFQPRPEPIAGSYSVDPCIFEDDDGSYYLYLGGIGEGQLQRWLGDSYLAADNYPQPRSPTLMPRMAKLNPDMVSLEHPLTEIALQDDTGNLVNFGDTERRFGGGTWVHKYHNTYYLSWSTGDTNLIQYATSNNPYGPFRWQGKLVEAVTGNTTQHAITEFNGKWYLFYHDIGLSGQDHLRSPKMTELVHRADGSIATIDTFLGD